MVHHHLGYLQIFPKHRTGNPNILFGKITYSVLSLLLFLYLFWGGGNFGDPEPKYEQVTKWLNLESTKDS